MGHWWLTPHKLEFDTYRATPIARAIGNVSLPEHEPDAALSGDGWRLLPLADPGAGAKDWQSVQRTVEVNAKAGTARAVYALSDRPAADYLAERRGAVNAIRDEKMFPGVVAATLASGKTIAADLRGERDMRNLESLGAQAARAGKTRTAFRFMDAFNGLHDLDATDMLTVAQAAIDHRSAVTAASWRIKAALEAAAANGCAALGAIGIDDGWPPVKTPPRPDGKS